MITELLEGISDITETSEQITSDILLLRFTIVNAVMVGSTICKDDEWVLIDTAMYNSGIYIHQKAEERFGKGHPPKCIILTHGHFDHIGSVIDLSSEWNVPVYAHELEMPYLTGEKDYPKGDSTVDGGLVAEMSPHFPNKAINLGSKVQPLPMDGSVPGMKGWRWIHTPGHTPGHTSLFRDSDRVLIIGDAFTTVKQESLISVLTQRQQISGPPAYYTTDWEAAEKSVKTLTDLKPSLVIPSHGKPLKGADLETCLNKLSNNFKNIALPEDGRFVK